MRKCHPASGGMALSSNEPVPKQNGTHVKRGTRWAKLGDVELEPGEPTYRRKGKAFIRAGRVGA